MGYINIKARPCYAIRNLAKLVCPVRFWIIFIGRPRLWSLVRIFYINWWLKKTKDFRELKWEVDFLSIGTSLFKAPRFIYWATPPSPKISCSSPSLFADLSQNRVFLCDQGYNLCWKSSFNLDLGGFKQLASSDKWVWIYLKTVNWTPFR